MLGVVVSYQRFHRAVSHGGWGEAQKSDDALIWQKGKLFPCFLLYSSLLKLTINSRANKRMQLLPKSEVSIVAVEDKALFAASHQTISCGRH